MFATPYRHLTRKTLHSYSNRTSIDFAVGASHVVAWRCVHRKPPKGGTASYRQQKRVVHRTGCSDAVKEDTEKATPIPHVMIYIWRTV